MKISSFPKNSSNIFPVILVFMQLFKGLETARLSYIVT